MVLDVEGNLPAFGDQILETCYTPANIFEEEIHSMYSAWLPGDVRVSFLNDVAGLLTVAGTVRDDLCDVLRTQAFNGFSEDISNVEASLLLSSGVHSAKKVNRVQGL